MRTILYIFFLLMFTVLIACSTKEANESVRQQVPEAIETQSVTVATTISTELPSAIPTPAPTLTLTPIATDTPDSIRAAGTSNSIIASIGSEPVLVATIEPDPYARSPLPENVWWSEDSKTLYYQDIETERAWAYDPSTGKTNVISYVPRSFRELAPQIEAILPENARLFSLSPSKKNILYRIPLPEPIPFPEDPDNPDYPPYNYELWFHQDGQNIQLGLVDSCFGLLNPYYWSANENVVIVNTAGSPDVRCLHSSWLIDLDAMSVGALDAPWEADHKYYTVRDMSADGNFLLVRADMNYFYNRTTKEKWPIPPADTANIILIDADPSPSCLFLEKEFSKSFFRTYIWNCKPMAGKESLFATFESHIIGWVISPDRKFIALIGEDQDFYPELEPLPEGIWLMTLP